MILSALIFILKVAVLNVLEWYHYDYSCVSSNNVFMNSGPGLCMHDVYRLMCSGYSQFLMASGY